MDARKSFKFHMAEEPCSAEIKRVAKFVIAETNALKGAALGEKREFICPLCNGKAVAVHRIHGPGKATAVFSKCTQCEIRIFS